MSNHLKSEEYSAFLDGVMPEIEKRNAMAHLEICTECAEELKSFQQIKSRLTAMPRRYAPPRLIKNLRDIYLRESIFERMAHWIFQPLVLKPLGVAVVGLILATLWMLSRTKTTQDYVDVEPLLTAHARYRSESLVHQGDLDRSDFSARLASYYKDENED